MQGRQQTTRITMIMRIEHILRRPDHYYTNWHPNLAIRHRLCWRLIWPVPVPPPDSHWIKEQFQLSFLRDAFGPCVCWPATINPCDISCATLHPAPTSNLLHTQSLVVWQMPLLPKRPCFDPGLNVMGDQLCSPRPRTDVSSQHVPNGLFGRSKFG